MSLRRSGLQKEVLALYRRALRMVNTKPPQVRPKFLLFVRYSFKTQASAMSPRDVSAIEHMLRRGRRQLDVCEDSKVRDCWVSEEMLRWSQQDKGQTAGTSRSPSA